jgi:hypothetical protein
MSASDAKRAPSTEGKKLGTMGKEIKKTVFEQFTYARPIGGAN